MSAGILVMVVMMGAMLIMGGHKMGHKHSESAVHEVTVSSTTAVSTAAVQNAEPEKTEGHAH